MYEHVELTDNGAWLEGSLKVPAHSMLGEYLANVSKGDECAFDEAQCIVVRDADPVEGALVTVLTRTQGSRREELLETLLCLSGQNDRRFEVLLIGHNVPEERRGAIQEIIDMQPEWLRQRIRFVLVEGGSRARPLNAGFAFARTPYVSILDDDDIVFDNWIASFCGSIESEYGKIILSCVFTQKWKALAEGGAKMLCASGSPVPEYCSEYDEFLQLSFNRCPTMALAFPVFAFDACGLRFDESLTTTEDWDFLMRAAFICGVCETGEAVAIYRLWEDAESSRSIHDEDEWERNRLVIQDKFAQQPLLFSKGSSEAVLRFVGDPRRSVSARSESTVLYLDKGDGFDFKRGIFADEVLFDAKKRLSTIVFSDFASVKVAKGVCVKVRDKGLVTLKRVELRVVSADGKVVRFGQYDMVSDSYSRKEGEVAFLATAPCFAVSFGKEVDLQRIEFDCEMAEGVSNDLLRGTRLLVRFDAWKRKMSHRMAGKRVRL